MVDKIQLWTHCKRKKQLTFSITHGCVLLFSFKEINWLAFFPFHSIYLIRCVFLCTTYGCGMTDQIMRIRSGKWIRCRVSRGLGLNWWILRIVISTDFGWNISHRDMIRFFFFVFLVVEEWYGAKMFDKQFYMKQFLWSDFFSIYFPNCYQAFTKSAKPSSPVCPKVVTLINPFYQLSVIKKIWRDPVFDDRNCECWYASASGQSISNFRPINFCLDASSILRPFWLLLREW